MKVKVIDKGDVKHLRSEGYNFDFNKKTGQFFRWGKTFDDDPDYGLPEICDMEISEICHGVNGEPCPFCYKSNVGYKGRNMDIETFKKVFSNLPKSVGQIAFGIGDIDGNPDLKEIILHSKNNGVIPNITINGDRLTDKWVQFFAENLGAIAVSVYDKELTYNTIKRLTDAGMKQVNIHFMISEQTFDEAKEIMADIKTDDRLKGLNALVMLSLKQKGRGLHFDRLSQEKFTQLVKHGLNNDINLGFDSCSAFKFLKAVDGHNNYKTFEMLSEPCESTCFSLYINVEGKFFPCSFTEGSEGWEEGIDVVNCNDFLDDVWFNERTNNVRNEIVNCRHCKNNCFYYDV